MKLKENDIYHDSDMLESKSIELKGKTLSIIESIDSLREIIKSKKDEGFDNKHKEVRMSVIKAKDTLNSILFILERMV